MDHTTTVDEVVRYLVDAMTAADLTQRALAARLGVSTSYLSRRLTGRARITLEDALAVCLELDLELSDVLVVVKLAGSSRRARELERQRDRVEPIPDRVAPPTTSPDAAIARADVTE